jgi:hypothetical protein
MKIPGLGLSYLLVLLLGFSSCHSKASAECQQLCSLSREQQFQKFKSFPVEQQFKLYIGCTKEKACKVESESPHDYYAQYMAADNRAAPFLLERLQSESDQVVQLDIIYVLRCMAVNGHLRGEHHIADVATRVTGHMKAGPMYRLFGGYSNVDQAKDFVKEIEANTR